MNNNIIWILEGSIDPVRKNDYLSLMKEMVETTKKEDGAIAYEWTISQDNKTISVYERYIDEEAAKKHLQESFSPYANRFLGLVSVTRFLIYSQISNELKSMITRLDPIFMAPIGGFSKF